MPDDPHDHPAPRDRAARSPADPRPSPTGEAFTWVARITAVGMGMAVPAVAGTWLDTRLGTSFLGPVGVAVGLAVALAWAVRLGAASPARRRSGGRPRQDSPRDGGHPR